MQTSLDRDSRGFQLLLLLSLSSALSLSLVAARVFYLETPTFLFLAWNLLLAWIPLAASLVFWRLSLRRPAAESGSSVNGVEFLLVAVWFVFFPNAPYMVTDLLHLTPRAGAPLWYDSMLLFSFAWNGLLLGFVSLWIVQSVAERRWGAAWSWRLAVLTLIAAAFGVYVGRFLRWNSWDVVTHPGLLVRDLLPHLLNPADHPRTVGVTVLFSCFLLLAYGTLRHLVNTPWETTLRPARGGPGGGGTESR